jgi:hypothetical protein
MVSRNSKYDDQVDSTSQTLNWVKDGVFVPGVVEYIRLEEAKMGIRSQSQLRTPCKLIVVRDEVQSQLSKSVRRSAVTSADRSVNFS